MRVLPSVFAAAASIGLAWGGSITMTFTTPNYPVPQVFDNQISLDEVFEVPQFNVPGARLRSTVVTLTVTSAATGHGVNTAASEQEFRLRSGSTTSFQFLLSEHYDWIFQLLTNSIIAPPGPFDIAAGPVTASRSWSETYPTIADVPDMTRLVGNGTVRAFLSVGPGDPEAGPSNPALLGPDRYEICVRCVQSLVAVQATITYNYTETVPEPATAGLTGIALGLVLFTMRRMRTLP